MRNNKRRSISKVGVDHHYDNECQEDQRTVHHKLILPHFNPNGVQQLVSHRQLVVYIKTHCY